MSEITLSSEEFKALSSETRTDLLKLLKNRNHTLSEFSKKTGLAAPTVKQHLETLCKAGLIEQIDEGRKWKYYSLTKKGSELIEPKESTSIFIMIAISFIALGIVLYSFMGALSYSPLLADKMLMQDSGVDALGKESVAGAQKEMPGEDIGIHEEQDSAPESAGNEARADGIDLNQTAMYLAAIVALSAIAGYAVARARRKYN